MPRWTDHTPALMAAAAEERLTWHASGRGLSYRLTVDGVERLLGEGERTTLQNLFRAGRLERGNPTQINGRAQRGSVLVTTSERLRQERAAARNQEATPS